MPPNKRHIPVEGHSLSAIATSIFLVVLGCILFLIFANGVIVKQERREEVAVILRVLRESLNDTQNMETGQRGYLLTNDSEYLTPFTNARDVYPKHLEELTNLMREASPADLEMPRKLAALMRLKEVEMGAAIELARSGKNAEAIQIVKSGRGKRYMDDIRILINNYSNKYRLRRLALESETADELRMAEAAFLLWVFAIAALIFIALQRVRTTQLLLKSAMATLALEAK